MNLEEYLFYKKLTLKAFCAQANISLPHLSRIFTGRVKPSVKTLRLISYATGCTVKPEDVFKPVRMPPELVDHVAPYENISA